MGKYPVITILGGGTSGLAAGYYAEKHNIPFNIYEASERVGGNCVTFKHGDFLFDSGAHRFHDKDNEITEEFKKILGDDFKKIKIPSYIYYKGKLVRFPLEPLNILKSIGPLNFCKVGFEILGLRCLPGKKKNSSFRDFALNTYGKTLAGTFLLNYSEKLWGKDCSRLSPAVSGSRLKGLNLKSFIVEALMGQKSGADHVDGSFYYPDHGIGVISEKLSEHCGDDNIKKNSKVTRILCDDNMIKAIEINDNKIVEVDQVVSTLPLDVFLRIMDPAPPERVLEIANDLCYRNVVLVVFFLAKESVTGAGTIYFPDMEPPITRLYEPRNRSIHMSPAGRTSLVIEMPCATDDDIWHAGDEELVELAYSRLADIGFIHDRDILSTDVKRLNHAYPVLEIGFEENMQGINDYLARFKNLKLSGRNGRYEYAWIHDMMRFGKEIIEEYSADLNNTEIAKKDNSNNDG